MRCASSATAGELMGERPTVLLINPNRMKPAVGPIGLDYLAGALAEQGFAPRLLDLCLAPVSRAKLAALLAELRPAAIGISIRNLDDCYYASQSFLLNPARSLVRWLKRHSPAPVVLGGVGYSIAPRAVLDYLGADAGICGDGEEAFPALLRALLAGRTATDVPGAVFPDGDVPTLACADLTRFPTGRRLWIDNRGYFFAGGQGNIETKRGCNRHCIYCADPVAKGRTVRRRPAEAVAEELERLERQGVHAFHFCDSEFNLPRRHAEEVCRAIIRRGLAGKIRWWTYASPAPFDAELARTMAAAGCAGINFGVDSGSDEQLLRLGRDHRAADLERTVAACRAAGLAVMYDLLLAGPGESRTTLRRTISRLKKWRPDRVGVSFGVRVFPGTPLAGTIRQAGASSENPHLHGRVKNNPDFLFPLFYVEAGLGAGAERLVHELIGDDPRFLFASRVVPERNYNYNDNRVLVRAIRRGARGAYWDILRTQV